MTAGRESKSVPDSAVAAKPLGLFLNYEMEQACDRAAGIICTKDRQNLKFAAWLGWRRGNVHRARGDVRPAAALGYRTVFIDRGYDERRPEEPDMTAADLPEAVDWIVGATSRKAVGLDA